MQRLGYWLMSDPLANPQFRRTWTESPDPGRRRPALAPTSNRPLIETYTAADEYKKNADDSEAWREAEALFAPGGAA